jgi:S1-C subfamily serine protease
MDVQEVGESGQRRRLDDDDDDDDRVVPEAWRSKPFRLAVMAAVVILMAGIGFGAGKLTGVGNNVILSGIPKPEATADPFIEGTGSIADNSHANILSTTAPGMVHIMSGRRPVGIGLVLTPSGKVLTTYQPAKGAQNLSARYVLSGATFKATVIGTDPAAGLALLQMAGRPGWPFVTVAVGNSDRLVQNAKISEFTSYHLPGQVYDTAVGTTGTTADVTIDVGTLTATNVTVEVTTTGKARSGLMASTLQSDMLSVLGGPLVDLNGKVIGITIGGSGSGLGITGYAIPINTALAVASQIDNGGVLPALNTTGRAGATGRAARKRLLPGSGSTGRRRPGRTRCAAGIVRSVRLVVRARGHPGAHGHRHRRQTPPRGGQPRVRPAPPGRCEGLASGRRSTRT